jgi:hypothetical protein
MILAISGKCQPYHSFPSRIELSKPRCTRLGRLAKLHLYSHGIDIDLFVEVVEECNCLDNHCVDLVWREFKLEPSETVSASCGTTNVKSEDQPRQTMTETEIHSSKVLVINLELAKQSGEMRPNATVKVLGGRVRYHF